MEILMQYWRDGGVREEPSGSYTYDGAPLMEISGSSFVVDHEQLFVHTEGALVSGWALVRVGTMLLFVEVQGSACESRTFSEHLILTLATSEGLATKIAAIQKLCPEYWYPERDAEDAAEIAALRKALALLSA